MKRRSFGRLAGSSLTAIALPGARAQSVAQDPSLLTTVLTPVGAERAGNADGSIPAWTGGLSAPPLPPDQPIDVPMFADEKPLYTVDSSNMAQYADLLSVGTKAMISQYGYYLKVYQTHRTAAFPQYVYDNAAKNVTRTVPSPAGLRFGFTGAYGGPPFPIIDTSDPLLAGAQLIWNDLLAWPGYSVHTKFAPALTVIDGQLTVTFGSETRFLYPYFDPNGSPETYDGYYYKLHAYIKAPSGDNGQEDMVWYSSNTLLKPNITWTVVNGQGRVRKAPDEAYDTPSAASNGMENYDESTGGFAGSPQKYDWKYIGKQEMLVGYNCNAIHFATAQQLAQPKFPNPDLVRWEKHRVWIVEATLHPGERNVAAKRRYYLDEDTWMILLGESYNSDGNMVKVYQRYTRCEPSLPGTIEQGEVTFVLYTGNYTYSGALNYAPYSDDEYSLPQKPILFDPEQMAASASF